MKMVVVRDSLGSLVGVLWAGGEIWHNAVLYHDSNYMGVDPKGEYVALFVFSTFKAANRSLNIKKGNCFFQKSTPWGIYCLRKVAHTSAVRLRASKLHCPLWLRSEVGKRGSQHCRYVY